MKNLEQIIVEIIELSQKAITASIIWEDIVSRCERYLKLSGFAKFSQLKRDLNAEFNHMKEIQTDNSVHRLEDLIKELNGYDGY